MEYYSHLPLAIAVAVGLLAAIILGQRLYTYALLRRMRFVSPEATSIARAEIPSDIRLILEETAPELEALGFEYLGSFRTRPMLRSDDPEPIYSYRYFNRATGCVASIHPSDIPEPGATASVSFQTLLADGRMLVTVNRKQYQFLPMPDRYLLDDGYFNAIADQWDLHQRRVADDGSEIVADAEQVRRYDDDILQQLLDYWLNIGFAELADKGAVRLTSSGARSFLRNMIAGHRRLAKLPRMTGNESTEARIAADLRAYHLNEKIIGGGAFSRTGKSVLFAVSAVIGIVAFGLFFSWEMAAMLLLVLLFHEFGHALAMRATGHRNVQVLVLPLLGAVASGRKDDAGPWARLFVLLAGPAPGLVVAVICLYAAMAVTPPHMLLLQLGLFALLLNLFNLLPLIPLDGGRIVELFLFDRWPFLRFVFFLASIVGLAGLGLWLDSHVLLALAIVLAVILRTIWRQFRLAAQIGNVEREAAPRAILTAMHQLPDKALKNFHRRLQDVRMLLPLVAARPPRTWESLLGMVIYVAVIVLPLLAVTPLTPVQQVLAELVMPSSDAEMPQQDWDAKLAAAKTPEERWQILVAAASWAEDEEGDDELAHIRYQQAWKIAETFPEDDLRRLDIRIALIRTGDPDRALAGFGDMLPELRTLRGEARYRLAEVLEEIHWRDRESPVAEQIAHLREAIAVRAKLKEQHPYQIAVDHQEIAQLLYREGDVAGAEAELRAALKAYTYPYSVKALAWLLIDNGRFPEAEELIRDHLSEGGMMAHELRQALAWSHWEQNDHAGARREMRDLLEDTPTERYWQRFPLLLDLIYFNTDLPEEHKRWSIQAKEEIGDAQYGADILFSNLEYADRGQPWLNRQTEVRRTVFQELGLPPSSQATRCAPDAGEQ